jgi:hypothetical protein
VSARTVPTGKVKQTDGDSKKRDGEAQGVGKGAAEAGRGTARNKEIYPDQG